MIHRLERVGFRAGESFNLDAAPPAIKRAFERATSDGKGLIDKLGKLPLLAQPGTRWSYSIGVDVQGYLVEKFSGMKFDEFLRTRLFEPLGMKDTAFYVPQEKLSRLALVHNDAQGGGLAVDENRPDPKVVPLGPSGGGGLFSTAMDYARFTEMLLNRGQLNGVRILAPRTVELMTTNQVGTLHSSTGLGFGLGFETTDRAGANGLDPEGAYGWAGAYSTTYRIDPEARLVIIFMTQMLPNLTDSRTKLPTMVYQALTDPNR